MINRQGWILLFSDIVHFLFSIISIFTLMFIMSFVNSLFMIAFGIVFIYVMFNLVDSIENIIEDFKMPRIKKYSNSKVIVMKYKYLNSIA